MDSGRGFFTLLDSFLLQSVGRSLFYEKYRSELKKRKIVILNISKNVERMRTLKTKYLTQVIGDAYMQWGKKKVILAAPTGMGKTTFIISVLLPYLRARGMKLLILCNRKLLRAQYWYDLVRKYDSYFELEKSVEITTYQALAEEARNSNSWENLLSGFQVVVCDECHYFYADSDFNGFGTYALLQAIIYAGMGLEMIFMSATMTEVKPLLVQTIKNCWTKKSRESNDWKLEEEYKEIIQLDYSMYNDFSRFHCICVPDEDTLCDVLVKSPAKSVIFIDNKERGIAFKERMVKKGGIDSQQIAVLNADNLDEQCNSEVVRNLAISHTLISKILITTAVLDNGVSIHDPDVENLFIVTESKVSFLQMIGRVRAEKVERCKLYFLKRKDDIFLKRMNKYQMELEDFKNLDQDDIKRKLRFYTNLVWDNVDKKADFYRNALVLMNHEYQSFALPPGKVQGVYGNEGLYINEFAKRKVGDMYVAESKFYSMAVSNPLKVIYIQMSWIEKNPDELEVVESKYSEQLERELRRELLAVQRYDKKQLQEVKSSIFQKYRKNILRDIPMKSGRFANDKMRKIVERTGLIYDDFEKDGNKKLYTFREE